MERRRWALVFLTGLVSLGYELVQVRMLAFFLDENAGFLAIPIALLGLALGSMACHFLFAGRQRRLLAVLSELAFPVTALAFVAVFAVADLAFPDIHVTRHAPWRDALRLVVYAALFLPPYAVFGAMLAALFADGAERIGLLYGFDLAGAALGCVLAPAALALGGLPFSILVVLLAAALLPLARPGGARPLVVGLALAGELGLAGASALGFALVEHPDARVLGIFSVSKGNDDVPVREVDVRWNAIARTSLLRAGPAQGAGVFGIVQDNGLSNVTVTGYTPGARRADTLDRAVHHGLPWHLGLEPRDILVMFAGIGRDMITFHALANGEAHIEGVEINPTVVSWIDHPALAPLALRAFHDLPGIELVNREGRNYLDHTRRTFDLVYVANNGAVHSGRTGHTRKFLDTVQAVEAYLDHLAPDGIVVFTNQPVEDKITALRVLLAERGPVDPRDAMVVFGIPRWANLDTLVVKPNGFSAGDVAIIERVLERLPGGARMLYSPVSGATLPRVDVRMNGPVDPQLLVTDDRPFTDRLDLANFTPFPTRGQLADPLYVSSWVKLFTLGLFGVVATGVALVARTLGEARSRLPSRWILYLLVSGIGYMGVEVGLIAKTELLVGNPLYAVAVNLAAYLIANALGAWLFDRLGGTVGPVTLALAVLAGVGWGLGVAELCTAQWLSAPLVLRVVAVGVAVLPVGMATGAFYPYAVDRLARDGLPGAIPITYALSTLASVLGSTAAITAIIDLGFTRVIAAGSLCYVLAAVLAVQGPPRSSAAGTG